MKTVKKSQPLVSVIMPAYNCEKYIEEAIHSVMTQTYKEWELIIIDDGSVDSTVETIKQILNKENRIRFFKNEKNIGVSKTRNRGISLANGEWIAFLDSDDKWRKDKLEKQMIHAEKLSVDFLFTGSSYINEEGKFYKGIFEVPEEVDYKKLRTHNVISCSSVIIKKRFFRHVKMENDDMHEDYALWLQILAIGIKAHGVNEPLLIYRISKDSKSGNKLKTLKMTYKAFRFVGIKKIQSMYFTSRHIIGSIKKYKKITFS